VISRRKTTSPPSRLSRPARCLIGPLSPRESNLVRKPVTVSGAAFARLIAHNATTQIQLPARSLRRASRNETPQPRKKETCDRYHKTFPLSTAIIHSSCEYLATKAICGERWNMNKLRIRKRHLWCPTRLPIAAARLRFQCLDKAQADRKATLHANYF